jgi:hypothetical protein
MNHVISDHQKKQVEVINNIEQQIHNNSLNFTTVAPVADYEVDSRICLTSVHLPSKDLKEKICSTIIDPLKSVFLEHFYYPEDSLHMTVKNIRVINDPPHFTDEDIEKAKKVFSEIIPKHKKYSVYFYRLLLFPMNLALIGTTDEELDSIVSDLDLKLQQTGVPDDKIYSNSRYFFSNITLARFTQPITEEFKEKVIEISHALSFDSYTVDSVTLVTCNAVFKNRNIVDTWNLL